MTKSNPYPNWGDYVTGSYGESPLKTQWRYDLPVDYSAVYAHVYDFIYQHKDDGVESSSIRMEFQQKFPLSVVDLAIGDMSNAGILTSQVSISKTGDFLGRFYFIVRDLYHA